MEWFRFAMSAICVVLGLFVMVVGIIGIYKFKFVLNRMHSAGMLDTMGLFFIVLGAAIAKDFDAATVKLLIVTAILWFTSPVSSHLIAKLEVLTDVNLNNYLENNEKTKEDK